MNVFIVLLDVPNGDDETDDCALFQFLSLCGISDLSKKKKNYLVNVFPCVINISNVRGQGTDGEFH